MFWLCVNSVHLQTQLFTHVPTSWLQITPPPLDIFARLRSPQKHCDHLGTQGSTLEDQFYPDIPEPRFSEQAVSAEEGDRYRVPAFEIHKHGA